MQIQRCDETKTETTGTLSDAYHQKTSIVLCCILPYSSTTFMMALYNASMEHFYYGLSKCMEYFGGVPEVVKSDNMTQWVKRSDHYEPEFNEVPIQWGLHYGTGLEAARVKKPRDKGAVEGAVYKVYKHMHNSEHPHPVFPPQLASFEL